MKFLLRVRLRERNLGGPYFYRLWPEVDYHFVTECLFTQLLERRIRVVKHSSNGQALMQSVYRQMSEERTQRSVRRLAMPTRSSHRDAGTENSTSINFFLRTYTRHVALLEQYSPRSMIISGLERSVWIDGSSRPRPPNATTDVSMMLGKKWLKYTLTGITRSRYGH